MNWILDNWLLLLFGGGMLAMHLFGHGHGRHGKKNGKDAHSPDETSDATIEDATARHRDPAEAPENDLANSVERVEFATVKSKK